MLTDAQESLDNILTKLQTLDSIEQTLSSFQNIPIQLQQLLDEIRDLKQSSNDYTNYGTAKRNLEQIMGQTYKESAGSRLVGWVQKFF